MKKTKKVSASKAQEKPQPIPPREPCGFGNFHIPKDAIVKFNSIHIDGWDRTTGYIKER